MQKDLRTSLFGYNKRQVKNLISRLKCEFEISLSEQTRLNKDLRVDNNIKQNVIDEYQREKQVISSTLILAQKMAEELKQKGVQEIEDEKTLLINEIRTLDGLRLTNYNELYNVIEQAHDIACKFEQDMLELKLRKESFLKSATVFNKDMIGPDEPSPK